MEHLKNLLDGARRVLDLRPAPRAYQVSRNGFATDAANLSGDFARVGGDLRAVLKRDKQAHQRTRQG